MKLRNRYFFQRNKNFFLDLAFVRQKKKKKNSSENVVVVDLQ